MKPHNEKPFGLGDAYSLETPDDSKQLYKRWADSYDQTFAEERGYAYPAHIAKVYDRYSDLNTCEPILDVGAGTGLVAEQLRKIIDCQIDAIDISAEMLEQSRAKDLYRNYIEADLTQALPIRDNSYGAVVSAGTFTHGHVGPAAIAELLRVARTGALFCLGVNAKAFDHYGFGSAFAALQADHLISPLEFVKAQYYQNAKDAHAEDIGYTAIFRKS